MSIYDEARLAVQNAMPEFKQGTISLVQVTAGAGAIDNPGTPTEVTTALNATVSGSIFKYVQMGLAMMSDLVVVAAPIDGITITKNDFIVIDGKRCKIIEDVSKPGAGVIAAWKFIVRK